MKELLEQTIRSLANGRCEYCQIPETPLGFRHVLDHVIARQYGGEYTLANLALACGKCNRYKGPNLAGIDPRTGMMTRLFHPRSDRWSEHFVYQSGTLVGLTDVGRTTVALLAINSPLRIESRIMLMASGDF